MDGRHGVEKGVGIRLLTEGLGRYVAPAFVPIAGLIVAAWQSSHVAEVPSAWCHCCISLCQSSLRTGRRTPTESACVRTPGHLAMDDKAICRLRGSSRGTAHLHALLLEPDIELAGIEPHELANLEEWDPPLGHQTSDMPARDSQSLGDAVDVQQWVSSVCPENWSTSWCLILSSSPLAPPRSEIASLPLRAAEIPETGQHGGHRRAIRQQIGLE